MESNMKQPIFVLLVFFASIGAATLRAQASKYPPLSEYLMPQDAEVALARSAAPPSVADRATIKVLTKSGYEVAHQGDNGSVCLVMRAFSAPTYTPARFRDIVYDPTIHAPICFTAPAARMVLPYYELRTRLAIEGKGPDQITAGVQAAYVKGELPRRDAVSFAYMWSADQNLGSGIGHWHPHMMIFCPYYENQWSAEMSSGVYYPK
jgi:hypothetical protein